MAWLPSWGQRIKLTIDKDDIDSALSDFPILIYLSTSSGRNSDDISAVFDELTSDGNRKKIAVTTSDGLTQCYVEIEKWDDGNEQAWLWVKVPSIASGADTILYLYYDADHADNTDYVGDTNSTPAENVWDANFVLVDHMADGASNAATRDSTSNNNDGAKIGANEPNEVDGQIAKAQDFDGVNDHLRVGGTDMGLNDQTVEFLFKSKLGAPSGSAQTLFACGATGSGVGKAGYWIYLHPSSATYMYIQFSDGSASRLSVGGGIATPYDDEYHYRTVTFIRDGNVKFSDNLNEYTGGNISAQQGDVVNQIDPMYIGKISATAAAIIIDEIRISNIARSTAWRKATYESLWDDLLAFGSEETPPAFQVTIDDSVVILARNSLRIDGRIEERSIAEFTVIDKAASSHYQKGQAILIYDPDGTLAFGGIIDTPEERRDGDGLLHSIVCADYHYLADKRIAAESYEDTLAGDIVTDLRTNYLDAEGVTIGEIQDGPTIKEAVVNYVRVSEALDKLAEKANFIWYIDENKALYFIDRETNAASWTATNLDIIRDSAKLSKGNPLYRNRQYVRGGRALTDEQVEERIGDGKQEAFVVGFPVAKVPEVTVSDRGTQTIGIKGLDTGKDWYWSKGDVVLYAEVPPADSTAIVFTYIGEFRIIVLSSDEIAIIDRQTVEGSGTGYVDDITEDTDATSKEAAFETASKKLQKYAAIGRKFTYQTHRSGLKPGQLQIVNYSLLNLSSAEMLIESVRIRADGDLLTYTISAVEGPAMGGWSRLFQRLAEVRKTAIDMLNVGEESILIILVEESEEFGWEETIVKTVFACPVVALDLYPTLTLYPC